MTNFSSFFDNSKIDRKDFKHFKANYFPYFTFIRFYGRIDRHNRCRLGVNNE